MQAAFDETVQNGWHLVTMLPEKNNLAKECQSESLHQSCSELIANSKGEQLTGRLLRDKTLYGYPVVVLVVYDPKLQEQKKVVLLRKANKELLTLKAGIQKIKAKSIAEAEKSLNALQKKAKLCQISLKDWQIKEEKGKRQEGAAKTIKEVGVKASVSIDQEAVERYAYEQGHFCLVTSDTETEWTAEQLFNLYQKTARVERPWRNIKKSDYGVENIYLKDNDHLTALLAMLMLSRIVVLFFENTVREALAKHNIVMNYPNGQAMPNPTWQEVYSFIDKMLYIKEGPTIYSRYPKRERVELAKKIFAALGGTWQKIIEPETYANLPDCDDETL